MFNSTNTLVTKNIFIDTSIFKKNKFLWDHKVIQKIILLSERNQIKLFLTTITKKEILQNIDNDVDLSAIEMKRFRSKATILNNIDKFDIIFRRLEKNSLKDELKDRFDNFCKKTKCQILSTNKVPIDKIFAMYFDKQPPFNNPKKQKEFPDAFALESLYKWCKENHEKMYIISNDNGMKDFCKKNEDLHFINSIEEFLHIYSTHLELSQKVLNLLDNNISDVLGKISSEFDCLGFYLEDQNGDVLSVEHINTEINERYLIDFDNISAFYELDACINFDAEISYEDLDTASYDSEDKVLIPWRTIEDTINKDYDASIQVEITLDPDDMEKFIIKNIIINNNRDIGISVDEIDHY